MAWTTKMRLIEDIAHVLSQLFAVRSEALGSICKQDTSSYDEQAQTFAIGRLVSMPFFWGNHVDVDISRGPFTTSKAWLHARLTLLSHDCTATLTNPESDDEEKETALEVQSMIRRLFRLLPAVFSEEQEIFALHHDDLSFHNILVDSTGALKTIVDWEYTGTMPLYVCCPLPYFLRGRERIEKPDPETYLRPLDENTLYQEDLQNFELTYLRKHFHCIMNSRYPAWAAQYQYHAGGIKSDFEWVVSVCDGPFSRDEVKEWLDEIENRTTDEGEVAPVAGG